MVRRWGPALASLSAPAGSDKLLSHDAEMTLRVIGPEMVPMAASKPVLGGLRSSCTVTVFHAILRALC